MANTKSKSLEAVQKLVKTHLGVADDDTVISSFIYSLYEQNSNGGNREFTQAVAANGGSEFPEQFINEVYNALKAAETPSIKDVPFKNTIPSTPGTHGARATFDEKSTKTLSSTSFNGDRKNGNRQSQALPENNKVYRGIVRTIKDFGAFIRLRDDTDMEMHPDGMCHISQITDSEIRHPSDKLKLGQEVYVRVSKVDSDGRRPRISLSMLGIDQITGTDFKSSLSHSFDSRPNRFESTSMKQGSKRRLTSPERWEIQRLIASGVASAADYPELQESFADDIHTYGSSQYEEQNNDIEVEHKTVRPKFLLKEKVDILDLSPPIQSLLERNVLSKEASQGSQLMKEFKEEKLKQQKAILQDKVRQRNLALGVADPLQRDKKTNDVISEWTKSQKNVQYGKRTSFSMKEQRESLPVFAMRQEIVKTIKENQFVVIVGETGSGKTTQIVQYLYEEGLTTVDNEGKLRMVGCTQPRRVAAVSVAKRVAEEMGLKVGETVGYTIRFEDVTGPKTAIKYMTDGMLEREALNDPDMKRYSVIMLDEAHERTVATDVLFALLKKAASRNPSLKIIVTSATLDSGKFAKYFNNCPILQIPGRTFPVEVLYTKEPETDYLASALDSVMQIHMLEGPGDILVFLTGKEEIDTSCEVLFERVKQLGNAVGELIILPVYSSLPSEMQSRIFEPTPRGSRKVILATNIAETSITIDGIYYVVDPGFVKLNVYDSRLGMDSLTVSPISQAQANQRSGRAGRTGPGKCYRLYTEESFKKDMAPNTLPEIQRQNLAHTILMLKAIGISDVIGFDFMDPPALKTMVAALQDLFVISALDDEGSLTSLGRKMADFPMEPALAKCLISLAEFGCSDEIMTIVAMLSVQTVFFRPKEEMKIADQRKAKFHHSTGDHLTLLNVYRGWVNNGHSPQWCKQNYIHERSMKRAQEVRKQLYQIMKRYDQPVILCENDFNKVRWALCAGYFKNSAKRDSSGDSGSGGYKTLVGDTSVAMHPSSALFGKKPEYVIYHSLLMTTREYMHCATTVEPGWLVESAPAFFQVADPETREERLKKQKIVPLFNRFTKDQDSWRLSNQKRFKK